MAHESKSLVYVNDWSPDDTKLLPDQKLALCITGWLLGSGEGVTNLSVSLSLAEVRDLIRQYLRTKDLAERQKILEQYSAHLARFGRRAEQCDAPWSERCRP